MEMIRLCVYLAGCCLCCWPTIAAPDAALWSAKKAEKLEALASKYVTARQRRPRPRAESISIAIGTNSGLLTARAFGNAAPGQPATPETIYRIGSLTKPFTAFAALKLLEQGAALSDGAPLSLTTPLNKVFGEVDHWRHRDGTVITFGNLLTMTSPLPNLTSRPPRALNPWGVEPAAQILRALKASSPRRVASTFEYSNTSYFLVSEVLDAVLGVRQSGPNNFRDFLRSELIEKLRLRHTFFIGEQARANTKRAKPHYPAKPAFVEPDWLKGSADMLSTASDIYKFNKALFDGRILDPNLTKLMFSQLNRVSPYYWYGIGWFIKEQDGTIVYSHSGSIPGFTAYNRVVRKKNDNSWLAITILTNNTAVEGLDILTSDIERLVFN